MTNFQSLKCKQQWCVGASALVTSLKEFAFTVFIFPFLIRRTEKLYWSINLNSSWLENIKNTSENVRLRIVLNDSWSWVTYLPQIICLFWDIKWQRCLETYFFSRQNLCRIKWTILKCQFSGIQYTHTIPPYSYLLQFPGNNKSAFCLLAICLPYLFYIFCPSRIT